ncbi:MAG: threonine/serine dehydratase [Acetobacteraceae bacterium]|nr:threonine/serine dehydratase [Acetobacteraceae bacterium]
MTHPSRHAPNFAPRGHPPSGAAAPGPGAVPAPTGPSPTLADVYAARERLAGAGGVVHTPCIPCEALSEKLGAAVHLKLESLQLAGAFKVRGALNYAWQLNAAERAGGLVTASSGSHGMAVALAARRLGTTATVFMPEFSSPHKRRRVEAYGGRVVVAGADYYQAFARARELAAERGAALIPAFDHPHIVAGQGTAGLELVEDLPSPDLVVVPVGGGGLAAGVALVVKSLCPGARVWGVQPAGAPSLARSLEAGRPVELDRLDTLADGIRVRRPGDLTFALCRRYLDGVALVSDPDIFSAVAFLLRQARVVAEPAGAAAVAALLSGAVNAPPGSRVVAVVSGGNLSPEALERALTCEGGGP